MSSNLSLTAGGSGGEVGLSTVSLNSNVNNNAPFQAATSPTVGNKPAFIEKLLSDSLILPQDTQELPRRRGGIAAGGGGVIGGLVVVEEMEALSFNEVDDRINEFQEDALVKEAFTKGVDLREYAKSIETDLVQIERDHVLDYVRHTQSFVDLYNDIQSCDHILGNMGELLTGFQLDLAKISEEIETLQLQSQLMNTRLKNRTSLEQLLNSVLDGLVISPDLIKKIFEAEINEFFVQHLGEINKKMSYFNAPPSNNIYALKEVGPELERIRCRATEKIRDFLIRKIEQLKAPNTNISIIQQSIFLKYKDLYAFLAERYKEAAMEVKMNYIYTVSNYYFASFEKYLKSMSKLQMVIADKFDLIGFEENAKRGLFGTKTAVKDKSNVYTLGERMQILTNPDPGIILGHLAEEQNLKFPFEAVFKSIHRLLLDNGCSEFVFSSLFFASPVRGGMSKRPSDAISIANFDDIFGRTMSLFQTTTKQMIDNNYDAVGLLLCIRVTYQNLRIVQKRRIPCLDPYLNAINMLLWPRFQSIMDMHIDSLKKAVASKILPTKDTHPHYITRRYSEFAASILTLNHGFNDALLSNSLLRLRTEVESLLLRLSAELPDKKNRLVFLINNYDLVVSILSEHRLPSFDSEKQYFNDLLDTKTTDFVEEELKPNFGTLMTFVQLNETDRNLSSIDQSRFEKVATEFNNVWKQGLSNINTSVIQSFTNFQNGAKILHAVLTQALLYYKRFLTIWETRFGNRKTNVYPVGLQAVMVEIKKYRSAF